MVKAMGIARGALGAALVVALATTAAWGLRQYVTTSPRFAITEVVVLGAKHRTDAELGTRAGVAVGQNVFSTDLDAARERLLADPFIAQAEIGRRLPGTVTIRVEEREAAAVVALSSMHLVARDGTIIKAVEPGDPTDLPVITGIEDAAVAADREGVTETLERALDLASDYEATSLGAKQPLQEIHVGADGGSTLVVGKTGLRIVLGAAPYRRKLEQATRVVAELERRGAKADAVFLDSEAHPDRVVARLR
jgi:cell division protein FtsQ